MYGMTYRQMYTRAMAEEFTTVARLRAELATVLTKLARGGRPLYVMQRGQPRAVLLDVERYRALMEQLEYLDDSLEAVLGRERRRAGEPSRPLADVLRDLSAKQPRRKAVRKTRAVSR
ncbi:MAG: type II toxin-antitoxin system Phd/YefM family antitoxin [Chloroflexi bacterium]|nr:type II toxin-antitoxin system Phd/YefM family antitoxin [Chloroflexota bacterium]